VPPTALQRLSNGSPTSISNGYLQRLSPTSISNGSPTALPQVAGEGTPTLACAARTLFHQFLDGPAGAPGAVCVSAAARAAVAEQLRRVSAWEAQCTAGLFDEAQEQVGGRGPAAG
jgi:hypothetical protein